MITQLYVFTPGSYVVADEWNANFRTIYKENMLHTEAIDDAYDVIAFPTSDLSGVFASIKSQPNSYNIPGNTVIVAPEQEYYKVLSSGQDLSINIPTGLNAESRIIISFANDRPLATPPFNINYDGTKIETIGNITEYKAGTYFIFIYETNNVAQIKVVKTGV